VPTALKHPGTVKEIRMTAKAAVAEVRSDGARSAQAVPEEFSDLVETDRPQFFGRVIVSSLCGEGPRRQHR
jgi:hypothetical protein